MFLYYCRSTSGKQVAEQLGIEHVLFNRNNVYMRHVQGAKLPFAVNWGCTWGKMQAAAHKLPEEVLNKNISVATSKRAAFKILKEAGIPIPDMLLEWVPDLQGRWLARKDYLSGGQGIEVLENGAKPSDQYHFLVKYIPKSYELRLHVLGDRVILEQFKYVPSGSNVLIRNHANGATFSAKPLTEHLPSGLADYCRELSIKTIGALGLQFGAVDILISKRGSPFILEVNTAPGLTNEAGTLPAYVDAFRNLIETRR